MPWATDKKGWHLRARLIRLALSCFLWENILMAHNQWETKRPEPACNARGPSPYHALLRSLEQAGIILPGSTGLPCHEDGKSNPQGQHAVQAALPLPGPGVQTNQAGIVLPGSTGLPCHGLPCKPFEWPTKDGKLNFQGQHAVQAALPLPGPGVQTKQAGIILPSSTGLPCHGFPCQPFKWSTKDGKSNSQGQHAVQAAPPLPCSAEKPRAGWYHPARLNRPTLSWFPLQTICMAHKRWETNCPETLEQAGIIQLCMACPAMVSLANHLNGSQKMGNQKPRDSVQCRTLLAACYALEYLSTSFQNVPFIM
ncbi:hypothetical protein FIBSPDRAFT_883760 [Athelia psychrophila]|uniref:Uncharacterized protein n=1 Tax=Athelia psychrophila TaxID=1759441 RepID=A0A166TWS1_9AGAM|nr:hypothetical protein FIBSPDRAFT_883760 [Fibularhizoctonia sp. CBS 109695]